MTENHQPFIERVTSRKFISYVVGMTISTVYLFTSAGDVFGTWAQFVLVLTGIYAGANVLHTAAERLGVQVKPVSSVPPGTGTKSTGSTSGGTGSPEPPHGPPSLPDPPEQHG